MTAPTFTLTELREDAQTNGAAAERAMRMAEEEGTDPRTQRWYRMQASVLRRQAARQTAELADRIGGGEVA